MTDDRPLGDKELEGLFEASRATSPAPSPNLITRIVADADKSASTAWERNTPPRQNFIAAVLSVIGGWPAAVGLATATVAGLAIGLGAPATLDTLSSGYFAVAEDSYQLEDLLPSYGDLLDEG